MNVLQHTRNELNLCLKENRPDRTYRDTLLISFVFHLRKPASARLIYELKYFEGAFFKLLKINLFEGLVNVDLITLFLKLKSIVQPKWTLLHPENGLKHCQP